MASLPVSSPLLFPTLPPTIVRITLPPVLPKIVAPLPPIVPSPNILAPVLPKILTPLPPIVPSPKILAPLPPIIPSPKILAPVLPLAALPPIVPKGPVLHVAPLPPIVPKILVQSTEFSSEMVDEETIINIANTMNKENFDKLLEYIGEQYHNDESVVGDEIYDELIEMYEEKYGKYNVVGAEPRGEKEDLPYYLGSLRKIKEEGEVSKWIGGHPGPYLIEDKIDGLTLLIYSRVIMGKRITKIFTRGRGTRGMNVSHILPYISVPIINEDIAVRGEIVMKKDAFLRIGEGFKNARNLVSGIINAKKKFSEEMARELTFYAYRIMDSNMSAEDDINKLQRMGFEVPSPVAAGQLNKEVLENYFRGRKEKAEYEVDGLVIYQNVVEEYPIGDTPHHVVAFKIGTETAITTVTKVVWRASKDSLLKPVVYYEKTNLSGADLIKASGYNARFIVNNSIGPGAKILLTRSGDVIPKIISVISPAPGGPSYPDILTNGQFAWNDNGVEFVLIKGDDNSEVITGKLTHFLKTLEVKNAGKKRVETMVLAGITSLTILLTITPPELAEIPGIGVILSNQLYDDIHERITNVSLAVLLDASGFFPHIGSRRFESILEVYPNLLSFVKYQDEEEEKQNIFMLQQIKGINMLANEIVNKLPSFVGWLDNHSMITISTQTQSQTQSQTVKSDKLVGMTFVFSGFRDKDLETKIKNLGGKTTTAVSRNTTMLILKDLSSENMKGKAQEAQAKGIRLISKAEFEQNVL